MGADFEIEVRSNQGVLDIPNEAAQTFIIAVGETGVSLTKPLAPIRFGQLRNSIQYAANNGQRGGLNDPLQGEPAEEQIPQPALKTSVLIGSSVEYAAAVNNGRRIQRNDGEITNVPAQPFLDDGIAQLTSVPVTDRLVGLLSRLSEQDLDRGQIIVTTIG